MRQVLLLAVIFVAGASVFSGTAAADTLPCPALDGATLFGGGARGEIHGPGINGQWTSGCIYEKDHGYDAGHVFVTWFQDRHDFDHCPLQETREFGAGTYGAGGYIGSTTRAIYVQYDWHDEPPGQVSRGEILAAAQQLLTEAQNRAVSCAAVPPTTVASTTTASTEPSTTTTETIPRCQTIDGQATDKDGKPIAGVAVRLEAAGAAAGETTTADDGRYQLTVPPDADSVRTVLLAKDARVQVLFGGDVAGAAGPAIDPTKGVCTQDFALSDLPGGDLTGVPSERVRVKAVFDAYQTVDAGWTLARRLQAEPSRGLPLQVFLACDKASLPSGVTCPTGSDALFSQIGGERPYIAVNADGSWGPSAEIAKTVGHEFGHFFMWSAFGAIAHDPRNRSHAGYYLNPSSADAWTEGFASFYSLMTRRLVSGDPEATVIGSTGDMEADAPAWQNAGEWEEWAVVGVLLDLADGAGDAGKAADVADLPVPPSAIHVNEKRDLFAAQVPQDTKVGTPWRADLLDASGRRLAAIRGAVVEWEGVRIAVGELPTASFATIQLALRPGARAGDDDAIPGDLFTVWPAILEFQSANPNAANHHVFDVHDLYRVAQLLYGSDQDRDGDGVPDVDQNFIAHGFFDDTKGGASNRVHDPGELAGSSGHTEKPFGSTTFPAMVPRLSPPSMPELDLRLDTGGVDATALVQVDYAGRRGDASFAELLHPDARGLVTLPVPPEGSGGTLSVILLAGGYEPAPALRVDPQTFWSEADRHHGDSFLAASVRLSRGGVLPAGPAARLLVIGKGSGFPRLLVGLLLVGLGIAAVLFLALRHRRSA